MEGDEKNAVLTSQSKPTEVISPNDGRKVTPAPFNEEFAAPPDRKLFKSLKDGTVSENYSDRICFEGQGHWIQVSGIEGLPNGLSLVSDDKIEGVPLKAGNFTLYFKYLFEKHSDSHPTPLLGECRVTIKAKQLSLPPIDIKPKERAQPAPPARQSRVSFRLSKNGAVNKPYEDTIVCEDERVRIVNIEGLPAGLSFGNGGIYGTPVAAGDFTLKVYYKFEGVEALNTPQLKGECLLFINKDPRELWLSKPSDKDDRYWKEDYDKKYIPLKDGWRMAAASKRGRSHAHVGSFRDDDFYISSVNGWNILIAADGAGSAKNSRKGSKIAADTAGGYIYSCLQNLGNKLDKAIDENKETKLQLYELFGQAALDGVHAIKAEAERSGDPYKTYYTTLLIFLHKKIADNRHFAASFCIGDGGVGVYDKKKWMPMSKPDGGEFAGQTVFLADSVLANSGKTMERINACFMEDFEAALVMTDGVTDPKFETDAAWEKEEKWAELWAELTPVLKSGDAQKLLEWLDFWSVGNHDDRTICVLSTINHV